MYYLGFALAGLAGACHSEADAGGRSRQPHQLAIALLVECWASTVGSKRCGPANEHGPVTRLQKRSRADDGTGGAEGAEGGDVACNGSGPSGPSGGSEGATTDESGRSDENESESSDENERERSDENGLSIGAVARERPRRMP